MASKVSEMLGASIDRHVVPLMAHLGLAVVRYPERLSVGTVARALGRALDESRTLFVTCWCDGGTATNLLWRLDVYDGRSWDDLQINFPFATPGFPPPRPAGGSHHELNEFLPAKSERNFERAVQFLGALLASVSPQIAERVPELREPILAALETAEWRAALEIAPQLWASRRVQGDVDPTELPAKVVFFGANLVVLEAGGERVSFKFSTTGIDKLASAFVSGWWQTPAGTRSATALRIGGHRWRFDFYGQLTATDEV